MSNSRIDPENPLPLYYQVYSNLKDRIEDGEFSPGEALPPERKLVEEFGVSRITIVKALDKLEGDDLIERQHGRGTFVKEITLEPTQEETTIIGFLPGGLLHPFHYSVQLGIAQVAMENHFFLQVFGLENTAYGDIENILSRLFSRIDGLIVYPRPDKKDLKLYQRLLEMGILLVMADRYYEEIPVDYVGYQHEQAGYELAKLMLERGHQRIAILPHFEINTTSIRSRIAGYRKAMTESGVEDIDDYIWLDVYSQYRPYSGQKGNLSMTQSLQAKIDEFKPTALIGINDDVAQRLTFDLMTINAERAKMAIASNGSPNYELDLEIASFATHPPEYYGPYVVAVAYQPGEINGQEAARLLISRLNGDFQGSPRHVEIPVEIIVREK